VLWLDPGTLRSISGHAASFFLAVPLPMSAFRTAKLAEWCYVQSKCGLHSVWQATNSEGQPESEARDEFVK
jgi:hypothetical protein